MIDVFRVGVHIGMSTNSSQVLSHMLRELTGVHVAASRVEQSLAKMKVAAVGVGMAFAGWQALRSMEKLLETGIKFNEELAKMKGANYSPGDMRMLETQAYNTMKAVPGSNLVDALKTLQDLRNVSGLASHAVELSPIIERTNQVLQNQTGKPAEQAGFQFMKFLEDSGRISDPKTGQFSEARVEQQARMMQAIIASTRGRVSGADLFQFRRSGNAAVNMLTDDGLINLIPSIMSMGADKTGTGIAGLQSQLLGATQLYGHTVKWLEQFDLVDPTKVHKEKGGRFSLGKGAMRNEADLVHDPFKYVTETVMPHLMADRKDKLTGKMVPGLTREQATEEIRRSGLLRPTQGLIVEIIQNAIAQTKEIGNIKRAGEVDQFKVMDQESPLFRIHKFSEAWENLQIALGKTIDVTQVLVPLTNALNRLNQAAVDHPEAAKLLMELALATAAITAIAGLAIAATAVTAMSAGLAAIAAVSGLAIAATSLVALAGGLDSLQGALKSLAALGLFGMGNPGPLVNMIFNKRAPGMPGMSTPELPGVLGGGGGVPGRSPNVPWSGKTYGPNGNSTNGKSGWLTDPYVYHGTKLGSLDGSAIRVVVDNAHDIGRGMSGAMSIGASRPQSGPTFQDYRYDLPTPGMAVG